MEKIKSRHPEKVNKPTNPIKKKPQWIRSKILDSQTFFQTKKVVNQNNLVLPDNIYPNKLEDCFDYEQQKILGLNTPYVNFVINKEKE